MGRPTTRIVINGRFLTQEITGVQRVAIEFCKALDDILRETEYSGVSVEIVAPSRGTLVTDLRLKNISVLRRGRLSGHAWEQVQLPRYTRGALLLSLGNLAPAWELLLRSRKNHVMVHDLSYRYFPDAYHSTFRMLYGVLMPLVLARAASVITVSEAERAAILREYPRLLKQNRLVVAQNGTSEPSRIVPSRDSRGRNCLYVGSLTKRKNASGLIETAIRLVRDHQATFTFIGSNGPSFESVELAVPVVLRDRIHFRGQVNDAEELRAIYEQSAVFVFPSFYEASPLPPLEAMAAGVPVVSSDIASLRERCGAAAIYCGAGDADSIEDAVVRLLDDGELWKRQQSEGLDRASKFSWHSQAQTVLNHLLALEARS